MHRQSLGSPGSKLYSHGGAIDDSLIVENDHLNRKDFLTSSSCSSSIIDYDSDDDHKLTKLHRLSSPPPLGPEKFIHLIPIGILICFLVLYLFSHNPSQSELAQFNGFRRPAKRLDSMEYEIGNVGKMSRLMEKVRKGDILAIRSLKNLQEMKKHAAQKSRFHRKLADF